MNEMRFALNSMHTLADSQELTNTVDSNQYICLGCGKKVHLSTAGGKSVFVHSQDNGNCKSKLYLKNLAKFGTIIFMRIPTKLPKGFNYIDYLE